MPRIYCQPKTKDMLNTLLKQLKKYVKSLSRFRRIIEEISLLVIRLLLAARDTFERLIRKLSRTKESIRRATRQAIESAKYGIANEIIELLIQKLENEPSSHRKVDLFFLVDSITQCSQEKYSDFLFLCK